MRWMISKKVRPLFNYDSHVIAGQSLSVSTSTLLVLPICKDKVYPICNYDLLNKNKTFIRDKAFRQLRYNPMMLGEIH
jgi:hypothetical protein